ncbi:MAG: N-acetylmuramoyl-L-alanine amidase [Paenibacillaceae bacterium]|nr:N-acetylmuramoyl-L-alanine amidase [Paenibacillaceae bacterium]
MRAVVWWSRTTQRNVVVLLVLTGMVLGALWIPWATKPTWMSLPLMGKRIVLDAGHGGVDGGAMGTVDEKTITLDMVLQLRALLEQAGAVVTLLREEDVDLARPDTKGYSRRKTEDLHARLQAVRLAHPDVFVSIHANAMPLRTVFGPQTFYALRHKESAHLAHIVQAELRAHVPTHRVAKPIKGIFLMDRITVPAVLIEVGFLSHPQESAQLARASYRMALVEAMYRALLRYTAGERAE